MSFEVSKKGSATAMVDNYSVKTPTTSYPDGMMFLHFDDLEPGEYEVKMVNSYYRVYHAGTMPYRVITYGGQAELPLTTSAPQV